MRRRPFFLACCLVIILVFSLVVDSLPAFAQTTTLSFSPTPAPLYLNGTNTVVVDLLINNGVNVNAFDIRLTYDVGIARLTSWVSGGYLDISGGCIININNPGNFWLVCTQLNKPEVSGNGVLIKLTFTGTGFGFTPVNFANAVLSDRLGHESTPTTTNGLINTLYQAGTIKYSSLTGSISLQGQLGRAGIPVTLSRGIYVGQGPYDLRSKNLLANNLVSSLLPMDAYLITTGQERYLNVDASLNKVKGILSTPTVLSRLQLYAGDVAAPFGVIDLQDLALVGGSIGQGSGSAADVNFDGLVNARDLALVAGNYGLNSATAYAGWVP